LTDLSKDLEEIHKSILQAWFDIQRESHSVNDMTLADLSHQIQYWFGFSMLLSHLGYDDMIKQVIMYVQVMKDRKDYLIESGEED